MKSNELCGLFFFLDAVEANLRAKSYCSSSIKKPTMATQQHQHHHTSYSQMDQLLPMSITSYSNAGKGLYISGYGARSNKQISSQSSFPSTGSMATVSNRYLVRHAASRGKVITKAYEAMAASETYQQRQHQPHRHRPPYHQQPQEQQELNTLNPAVRTMNLFDKTILEQRSDPDTSSTHDLQQQQQQQQQHQQHQRTIQENKEIPQYENSGINAEPNTRQQPQLRNVPGIDQVEDKDDFSQGASRSETVVIHVHDEANNINRDFRCRRSTLLREMKYFRTYLNDNTSFDDIDISVHCDVNIFEWLMTYIHRPQNPPRMDTAWAVSILISSDFLEMGPLVESTLQFVKDRLQSIIRLPIELDCINNRLVSRLAQLFTDVEIEDIKDKKDKIVNRLYMNKLERMLLENVDNTLFRCTWCSRLFTRMQQQWMVCPKAKVFIDFHGKVEAKHNIDPKWSVNHYIIRLKQILTWREIYWRLWGLINTLHCVRCGQQFATAEFGHCSYHPQEPSFENSANVGSYPCCDAQALRFDSSGGAIPLRGCRTRNHVVDTNATHVLDVLLKHQNLIVVPFDNGVDIPQMLCDGRVDDATNDDISELVFSESGDSDDDLAFEGASGSSARDSTNSELTTDDDCKEDGQSDSEESEDESSGKEGEDYRDEDEDHDEDEDDSEGDGVCGTTRAEVSMALLSVRGDPKYEIFHSFSRHRSVQQRDADGVIGNNETSSMKTNSGGGGGGGSRRRGERFDWSPKVNPVRKRHIVMDQQRDEDRRNMDELMKLLGRCRKEQRSTASNAGGSGTGSGGKGSTRRGSSVPGRPMSTRAGAGRPQTLREMQLANTRRARARRVFR